MSLRTSLIFTSQLCRYLAWGLDHWGYLLLLFCILSPIGPHVRVPYAVSYSAPQIFSGAACEYVGSRGVIVKADRSDCPIIVIIKPKNGEGVSW